MKKGVVYTVSEPPRFEDIDWVALAKMCGIHLTVPGEPTVISLMSSIERSALAEHYISLDATMDQINDELDQSKSEWRATSLDKAHIKLMVNRGRGKYN